SEDETPGFVRFCIFPNPFNPETNIVFSLLEDTHVELTIYNIKGQKVRTICNEMLGKGNYIYVWNGKDKNNLPVASGIYFSEFETDGIIKIKKMLLLK
ncbi:MAG: T9SS type A sorting domain-containing protein, partial [Candidatus Cloacimonetes bacterium]|nr:T9SS type A sorting domain-containing protein [Candidatus Cloacimonadota bacterium]